MKSLITLGCVCLFQIQSTVLAEDKSAEAAKVEKGEWIQLFNGKDMKDWTPKFKGHEMGVNHKDTFVVEDGLLRVKYDNYEKWNSDFGHLFFKTPYSRYILRCEYRFVGDQVKGGPGWALRNNGLMVHCQDPSTMKKDQSFPKCIEVQLLGGDPSGKGKRSTMNLCTPGTHVVLNISSTNATVSSLAGQLSMATNG